MLRCKTTTLSKEETHHCVTERLKIAGAAGNPSSAPKLWIQFISTFENFSAAPVIREI